ncbi:MAG: CRISPR-associated endoribonuclease Cas6 [Blastocatellia bacterium]|nr:CRISPR-associated endoribonuclease Cas6 [Blastocatellia bacterium]
MRVNLTLLARERAARLPLNYNHAVASLIYGTLGNSSTDFAARLHDEGFNLDGRSFKLFTFSRLNIRRSRLAGDHLLLQDPKISFQISSPFGDFIEHFVAGLFASESFNIAGAHFRLTEAETLPAPVFSEQMSFRALSPITESVRDEQDRIRYLAPEDDWSEFIERNLKRKYRALYGTDPAKGKLNWKWDRAYIEKRAEQGHRASVLIDIRGIKIRGWLAPFVVEGSPELIELGYEAGFGSRNSMGFGMVEVA